MLLIDKLDHVRNAPSTKYRQKLIARYAEEDPFFRRALVYSMDPFIVFNYRCDMLGGGVDVIDDEFFTLLYALAYHSDIAEVKKQVEHYVRQLSPDQADLARDIINKELRIGAGAVTINKAVPGLIGTFDVMLAYPINYTKIKYPCYATPKIEGQRCIYKYGKFYTRRGKPYVGLEIFQKALNGAPDLDCEIIIPGMDFYSGSGKLRSYAHIEDARLYVLDAPTVNANSSKLRVERAMSAFYDERIVPIPHILCNSRTELHEAFNNARREGLEGLVVRPLEYDYVPKRSYYWMKIKAKDTIDGTIVAVNEGEGKYENMLGSITVRHLGTENFYLHTNVGTGFTDKQRAAFWEIKRQLIGKTVEIDFHEFTPMGYLREPRFVGIREDK